MLKKTNHSSTPSLSIVIPIYNEAAALPFLLARFSKLKSLLPTVTELILVDDGSQDTTVKFLAAQLPAFSTKVICLSRNFGHQAALLAGLAEAQGDYVVTLDGDLQHPPELIPEMLALHRQGYDMVLTQRQDGVVTNPAKKITSRFFYAVINFLSDTKIEENSSDFRSMSQETVEALLDLPEQRKFIRGMIQWLGFKTIIIPFQVQPRIKGESKYSFFKMLTLAMHGLTSFSPRPLYFSGALSILLFLMAVIYAAYVLYIKFFGQQLVEGWASVLFVELMIGAFLALCLALIGLYLAAIYDEVKARPNYIIKEIKKLKS